MPRARASSEFRDPEGLRVVRGPSKFEGELYLTELAYLMSLDGGTDDEAGSSTEGEGWYGLMGVVKPWATAKIAKEESGAGLTAAEEAFLRDGDGRAGVILFERTDGFVEGTWFKIALDRDDVWEEIQEEHAAEDEDED